MLGLPRGCPDPLAPTQKPWPQGRPHRRVLGLEEESDDSLCGPALQGTVQVRSGFFFKKKDLQPIGPNANSCVFEFLLSALS